MEFCTIIILMEKVGLAKEISHLYIDLDEAVVSY